MHKALKELAPSFITNNQAHHYLGFAATQERLFEKTGDLKPALYLHRVLLTGHHLMRTGELETDLNVLGNGFDFVRDLIALKRDAEHGGRRVPAYRAGRGPRQFFSAGHARGFRRFRFARPGGLGPSVGVAVVFVFGAARRTAFSAS
ncbi:Predicted nucleotidyltransferase [Paractinoplanes atraurantiacus]|uniref:Predicted nucleotidyltransferase n=1 Tax=Paractinoplanes atraurantiacus TaxID=1036182 RepID=A0A285I9R3_9ACTN|nr:nucleotidyltransferase domain-containing protein [Actinoplanes atraurantiacus]SNY44722.1 Predicted nucleotidyltransferase [Actinoplanes atraurantiacus]